MRKLSQLRSFHLDAIGDDLRHITIARCLCTSEPKAARVDWTADASHSVGTRTWEEQSRQGEKKPRETPGTTGATKWELADTRH